MQSLTNEIGVYVLCDLDQVPIYVGRSTDGVSDRICGPICGPQAVTFVSVLILLLKSTMDWRRGRDSNPRYGCPYSAFRVRRDRPLCHLSAGAAAGSRLPSGSGRRLAWRAGGRKALGRAHAARDAKTPNGAALPRARRRRGSDRCSTRAPPGSPTIRATAACFRDPRRSPRPWPRSA